MWAFNKMHNYRADYWDASKYHVNLFKHFSDSVFFSLIQFSLAEAWDV